MIGSYTDFVINILLNKEVPNKFWKSFVCGVLIRNMDLDQIRVGRGPHSLFITVLLCDILRPSSTPVRYRGRYSQV